MSIRDEVDRLIDERPGRELLDPDYDEKALALNDFIFRSAGTSASTMIVAGSERVIVNTGMGWEAPHHKALFDTVHTGPTPYIITTQGHVDHVGGVSLFRETDTRYVAQANNPACQADDARLPQFRGGTALTWFPHLLARIKDFAERYPDASKGQDVPSPDLLFEERLALRLGELGMPIVGHELIDACLGRLHDAVDHVHRQTLAAMNAGKDLYTIMRETRLPPDLRVGQGYGKIEWAARTIWEEYTGWFQRRSTADLYGTDPNEAGAELAVLAGTDRVLERARARLAAGDAPTAIRLAEAVLAAEPESRSAAALLALSHQSLLEAGGDVSFWENGWLEHEAARWRERAEK